MKDSETDSNPAWYTLAEFAALFGKERTWAYRLLYAGKILAITGYGTTRIAHSEVDKILNGSSVYRGRRATRDKKGKQE